MTTARRAQLAIGVVGGVLAALIVVIAIAMAQGVGGPDEGRTTTDLGEAPRFTLNLYDDGAFEGDPLNLAEQIDRPVFIYFWASWCIPCEEEAPIIESVWPEYAEQDWLFIGMNIWDTESDAERFVDRFDLTFPVVRDVERSVYVDYGVQGLPVAYFLAPGLDIYARYDGLLTEDALRELLDEGTALFEQRQAAALTGGAESRSS